MGVKVYCDWNFPVEIKTNREVELFVDTNWKQVTRSRAYKVLLLCEPRSVLKKMPGKAISKRKLFDLILTYDEEVLKKCLNAVLFEFGSCWVPSDFKPEKEFSVSTVVGGKSLTDGHRMRQEIWKRQADITIPRKFYRSSHGGPENAELVLGESKLPLFYSQFHICIENSRFKYYFTEKLIDCFLTRTVPVYWGCPNISDYFNTKGILPANDANAIIAACNSLTPQSYLQMAVAMEDNYQRALQYRDLNKRVGEKIDEVLNK